jgi:hypothetical protein
MKYRSIVICCIVLVLVLIFSSCAPGSGSSTPEKPAGFLLGIWHGWIAPISIIWGLFNSGIRVYEPLNTGWWYDLGFYLAIVGGFGSFSFFRKRNQKHSM